MNTIKVFYFHNLDLSFKSAQTIQVVKDYFYLSKQGVKVSLYGTYKNEKDFIFIREYLANSKVTISAEKHSSLNKIKLRCYFFIDLLKEKSDKIIITRHYRKLSTAIRLKSLGLNSHIVHEMHEESFPYLFKEKVSKKSIKSLFFHRNLDFLIFTNFSQKDFFLSEFEKMPNAYAVLPNGVEIERFEKIKMAPNFVLTYGGGFNKWKNLDLVFEALSLLEAKYTLRIAGGKDDHKSIDYIHNLISKYSIETNRISYLGFINNYDFPEAVLNNSNLLILPLGNNIQSKYLTSPMKLFEYMSTKIPVLAVDFPSVSCIAEGKIYLSNMNARNFAKSISQICESNEEKFDSKAMNLVAEKYSYKNRSKKFMKEVINELF